MAKQNIRVASYNIRKAKGLDQRRDPGRILDVINHLAADVVVLQEADLRLGARKSAIPRILLDQHSDLKVAPIARNDVGLGWHGNAVLVKPNIAVDSVEHIELPGLEPRGAVRLSLSGPKDFTLVATHLGLRRKDRRNQQRSITSSLATHSRTIIAGDFNEWSSTNGLEIFQSHFSVYAPGRSFHARRPIAALDRLALSQDLVLCDSGVEDGPIARRASDHLPIWGNIQF